MKIKNYNEQIQWSIKQKPNPNLWLVDQTSASVFLSDKVERLEKQVEKIERQVDLLLDTKMFLGLGAEQSKSQEDR